MGRRAFGVIPVTLLMMAGLSPGEAQVRDSRESPARVLSVEEAVQLALAHNLSLQDTVDSVYGAQISQDLAESRFDIKLTPSFAGGFGSQVGDDRRYGFEASKLLPYGATVTANASSDLARNEFTSLTASNLSFTLTQPLLRGFGPKATQFDLENAKRTRQSSERNLEVAQQRLAVEVVASYYDIVRQEGLIDVAEGSVERSKELLRASEARLKVGLASQLDVFRAELLLSQAEESLINREEARELAMDTFKFNLGLDPQEEVYLEMVEPDYQPVTLDLDAQTQLALNNRLEIREERDRIHDSARSLSVSRQNLLPQLDLNVRYERLGFGTTFNESFDFDDDAFGIFLSTSYTLDQAPERASVAQSQLELSARRRSVQLLEYNVTREVRAACRNVERIGKSIGLQEKNIDFAEKQLRLASLRYQRGLANNFDIIDAENNLISARSSYVSLIADYNVALIELKRVTGALDLDETFAPGGPMPPARHHP
ncbi:MAG: TolC family protein [Vicinamibacteria bacterium]